jgi:SpoVK/Ycf46/Vps4 family AAA+-type ATPase
LDESQPHEGAGRAVRNENMQSAADNRARESGLPSRAVTRFAALPVGLVDRRELPNEDFTALWDAIKVDGGLKDRLLAQAVLNFTLRGAVSRAILPLHGVILMQGPPGTGKTSLAKGLASRVAESFGGELRGKPFRFVEVDPHALSSGSLGKTQRAVTELFASTIAEQAQLGPTIILLDEVETILADRTKLSLEANPIDVHRATDAALVQLDHLAETHPDILFVATSNFPQAIDRAFVSRADLVLTVPLPDEEGRLEILRDTLAGMAVAFPRLHELSKHRGLSAVASAAAGLDGRSMRKLVAAACSCDKQVALDPSRLTIDLLLKAATVVVVGMKAEPGRRA